MIRRSVSKSRQTTLASTGSHSKLSALDTRDQGEAVKLEGCELSAVLIEELHDFSFWFNPKA